MCRVPGSWMLSVQLVVPVSSRASSLRRTDCPIDGLVTAGAVGDVGHWASSLRPDPLGSSASSGDCLHQLGGVRHRLDDVLIAGAATEVALQPFSDLGVARVGVLRQQVDRGQHHAGRAVAALQAVAFLERGLHRMPARRRFAVGQTLDGGDACCRRPGRPARCRTSRCDRRAARCRRRSWRCRTPSGCRPGRVLSRSQCTSSSRGSTSSSRWTPSTLTPIRAILQYHRSRSARGGQERPLLVGTRRLTDRRTILGVRASNRQAVIWTDSDDGRRRPSGDHVRHARCRGSPVPRRRLPVVAAARRRGRPPSLRALLSAWPRRGPGAAAFCRSMISSRPSGRGVLLPSWAGSAGDGRHRRRRPVGRLQLADRLQRLTARPRSIAWIAITGLISSSGINSCAQGAPSG